MRCVLREVRDEDLPVLFEQWADPVAAHMAAFTPSDHMDREAFERRWSRLRADETVIARAIVVDGELAGTISSWGDPGERELTYWIGRAYWGKGIATAALEAFLGVDPSRPLGARVASDNVASRRVLEKCGFRITGTERGFAQARSAEIEELVLRLDGAGSGAGEDSRVFRPGGVSYLRIPAGDARVSAAFYEQVFGWSVDAERSNPRFEDGTGHVIGHFMTDLPVAGEAGVLPYVFVESVDEALARSLANGGEVVRSPYAEGNLRVATLRDPAGNVVGVWQR